MSLEYTPEDIRHFNAQQVFEKGALPKFLVYKENGVNIIWSGGGIDFPRLNDVEVICEVFTSLRIKLDNIRKVMSVTTTIKPGKKLESPIELVSESGKGFYLNIYKRRLNGVLQSTLMNARGLVKDKENEVSIAKSIIGTSRTVLHEMPIESFRADDIKKLDFKNEARVTEIMDSYKAYYGSLLDEFISQVNRRLVDVDIDWRSQIDGLRSSAPDHEKRFFSNWGSQIDNINSLLDGDLQRQYIMDTSDFVNEAVPTFIIAPKGNNGEILVLNGVNKGIYKGWSEFIACYGELGSGTDDTFNSMLKNIRKGDFLIKLGGIIYRVAHRPTVSLGGWQCSMMPMTTKVADRSLGISQIEKALSPLIGSNLLELTDNPEENKQLLLGLADIRIKFVRNITSIIDVN